MGGFPANPLLGSGKFLPGQGIVNDWVIFWWFLVDLNCLPPLSVCILSANLWTRLGTASKTQEKVPAKAEKLTGGFPEEEDSELQRAWGALIKEKEQSRQKKSRLDHLPSLQIEISRESSSGSDTES